MSDFRLFSKQFEECCLSNGRTVFIKKKKEVYEFRSGRIS